MTEKRNITRDDILLKARLGSEGCLLEITGPPPWKPTTMNPNPGFRITLDDCDMVIPLGPESNSNAALKVSLDGTDVTISESDELLRTARLEPRAAWRDKKLSNGLAVDQVIMCTDDVQCNIIVSRGCHAAAMGKACRFCGLGPSFEEGMPLATHKETLEGAELSIQATIIAINSGWRGFLNLAGGATPPERRDSWTTDILEAVMARFREDVDADVLSELQVAFQGYPPANLNEMNKWKGFGINSVEYDNQVLDPDYFKAVCPGRGPQEQWFEAQEAAAEIFGRGRGSISNIVTGIEPMAGMLEGVEERISRGVWSHPITFFPAEGSAMEGMRSASMEWHLEAMEKIADIYMRYADTLDVDLTEDNRWGYTRTAQTTFLSSLKNEIIRRVQEMGKLPPGLPNQYGINQRYI